jgi:hypothetical protein
MKTGLIFFLLISVNIFCQNVIMEEIKTIMNPGSNANLRRFRRSTTNDFFGAIGSGPAGGPGKLYIKYQ